MIKQKKKLYFMIPGILILCVIGWISIKYLGINKKDGGVLNNLTNKNIYIWCNWDDSANQNRVLLEKSIKEYEAKNKNIKIKLKCFGSNIYKSKVQEKIKSGIAPDIYLWWGANELKALVDSGAVLNLDKYLKLNEMVGNSLLSSKTALKYLTFNNKIYAIPFNYYLCTLFINEELFEKKGVTIPESYNGLLQTCESFRDLNIQPIALAGKDKWPIQLWINYLYLRKVGISEYDRTLTSNFKYNNDKLVSTMNDFKRMVEIGAFQDDFMAKDYNTSLKLVLEGKTPMILMGNWIIDSLQRNKGENPSKVRDKMKPIIFPMYKNGQGRTDEFLGGAIESFVVNAKTKHKKEVPTIALEIIKRMALDGYNKGQIISMYKESNMDNDRVDPLFRRTIDSIKEQKDCSIWWDVYFGEEKGQGMIDSLSKIVTKNTSPNEILKEMNKK